MKKIYTVFFLLIPCIVAAQLSVVSSEPANNAKNVQLTATISLTFSEALDTNAMNSEELFFSNLNNDSLVSYGYSADLKTTYGVYKLQPNTAYFLSFFYAKAASGAVMTTPYVYYFTTGSDFPPYTVSGTVSSGSTGVTPEDAVIALATENIFESEKEGAPLFYMGTIVNTNGTYSIPNVANGTYWPLAVKDANHDGKINPEDGGDVLAFSDSIIVSGANVTGLNLEFFMMGPLSYADALKDADTLKKDIPNDFILRQISAWNTDTLGQVNDWEFIYTRSETEGYQIRVSSFDDKVEPIDNTQWLSWLHTTRALTGYTSAALLTTVVPLVENHGGREFRYAKPFADMRFRIECQLGDHNSDQYSHMVPDQSKFYWGITYTYGYESDTGWYGGTDMRFLCDFTTGAVIAQSTNSVKELDIVTPDKFVLAQNYPNPFNPSTIVRYAVAQSGFVMIKIYDMLGKEIATLVNEEQSAGWKEVRWNATGFTSGMYLVRMHAGNFVETKKILLIK